jgi:hypothetical protein
MIFDSVGPIRFPRIRAKGEHWKAEFWNEVEGIWEGLSGAIGCYAFGIEFGDKVNPWYVGKTVANGGFKKEVFEDHKLEHYNSILKEKIRGNPTIVLFPMMKSESNWVFSNATKSGEPSILWLEKTLITMAHSKNADLKNSRDTKFLRSLYVNGLFGGQYVGKPAQRTRFAQKMFQSERIDRG